MNCFRSFSNDELRSISRAFSAAYGEGAFGPEQTDRNVAREFAAELETRGINAEWAYDHGDSPPAVWLRVMLEYE